ncbi:MAG: EVE domain-containing protein [Bacteroidetes bacterium]|nr:EVE domain-containing protein [Bacteroidota bacterium]
MSLQKYIIGTGEKTGFCYDLEFRYRKLGGIGGGNARKFGLYQRNDGRIWFDPMLGDSPEEAWVTLRSSIVRMLDLAEAGQWEEIDEISELSNIPMVRLKTLFLYHPDQIIPVNARDALLHFHHALDPGQELERNYNVVTYNRGLLQKLRDIDLLKSWNTWDLAKLLYDWSDPRKAARIMKIPPGEKARFWPECLSNGYICVGWDEMGDLTDYESKDAFRERFATQYATMYGGHKSTMVRKGNELWRLTELRPGDIVVANNGISSILAVGTVQDPPYQWRPDRHEYKHTVNVEWDTSQACTVVPQKRWGVTTVLEISPEELTRILAGATTTGTGPGPSLSPAPITPGRLYERMERELERTGQIILYGPPGTGKTYTTRRFAAWWLAKQSGKPIGLKELAAENINDLERRFKLASAGRVWWMVANPANWSWDQLFKDGSVQYTYGRLHRNFPLVQVGDLVIGYESTPVKRIVALARVNTALGVDESGELGVHLEPLKKIENGMTYDELQKDVVLKDSEPLRFRNQGTLFALNVDESDYLLSALNERDPGIQKYLSTEERIPQLTWLTFHASYSYEDFIEGFRPVASTTGGMQLRLEDGVFKQICREAVAYPDKPYLVCIDEVNRSNIAKVLGELVTLLEKDKRGMEVILPQSKERFTIPPNVHLVCTMNTADRSIKLLDAAVRRRFSFIEVMPDLDLLEGVEIDGLMLQDFLAELNRRIARREGREKLIGHSYFLKNGVPISTRTAFCDRVRHDILPLLEEYCYDDISALAGLLGEGLIDTEAQTIDETVISNEDDFFNSILAEFSKHE